MQSNLVPSASPSFELDYVDRFAGEWQAQRPDLNMPRLSPLMRIVRLGSLLDKELASIAKDHSITGAQFQVLAALRRLDPQPQSLSELTRIAILTSGSMTSLVDRLEARDFVRRQRHPADRRGVLLTLTSAGRSLIDAALDARMQRLHDLADAMGDDQRNSLAESLRKLLLAVDGSADSAAEEKQPDRISGKLDVVLSSIMLT